MKERNIIGGFTAAVLSPFIEGWQQMLEITRKGISQPYKPDTARENAAKLNH